MPTKTPPKGVDENAAHPFEWPILWFRDQAFWREVATRTIAGALALIAVGAPALLVLIFTGAADGNTWWALLAALILFAVAVGIWFTARTIRNARAKASAKSARRTAEDAASTLSGIAVMSIASGIAAAITMIFVQ